MHYGVASATFEGDRFWLGRDQLAWQRLLVGIPQLILLTFERGGYVFLFWRWRRRNDRERAAIGAFELFADIRGEGKQTRIANAAVETDVFGLLGRCFLWFRLWCFWRGPLVGRSRNGERQ